MMEEETKRLLKKRILANIIDFWVFLPLILISSAFLEKFYFIVIFVLVVLIIYQYSGYTIGGYIIGLKTIWKKDKTIKNLLKRFVESFIVNFFSLNFVGDFRFNSCGQFKYDKKYFTYTIDKREKENNSFNCSEEYIFYKFYDYSLWFGLYIFCGLVIVGIILHPSTVHAK